MKIDENQVVKVSRLARLELTDNEKTEFSRQLNDIIEYVEKINELPTDSVAPADHIVDLNNVVREDCVGESLSVDEIEKVAPQFEERHFVVPKVID